MGQSAILAIGTRGSPLALAQAREAQGRLSEILHSAPEKLPLQIIRTTGDAIQDRSLSEAGGKGLFTKELDSALLEGAIDLAVHSAKDLPTYLPEGLVVAGYLPREDVRDAFISRSGADLAHLAPGSVVGSASLRRQAQVLRRRPDLSVRLMRGNVGTRLAKLESGEADATLLALAGLKRLGLTQHVTAILDIDAFLPAVGQGAIALTIRAGDARVASAIAPLIDEATAKALAIERAFLAVLDGSCRTPIAGHARILEGRMHFRGMVLSPDGAQSVEVERWENDETSATDIGREAGLDLRSRLPAGFLPA